MHPNEDFIKSTIFFFPCNQRSNLLRFINHLRAAFAGSPAGNSVCRCQGVELFSLFHLLRRLTKRHRHRHRVHLKQDHAAYFSRCCSLRYTWFFFGAPSLTIALMQSLIPGRRAAVANLENRFLIAFKHVCDYLYKCSVVVLVPPREISQHYTAIKCKCPETNQLWNASRRPTSSFKALPRAALAGRCILINLANMWLVVQILNVAHTHLVINSCSKDSLFASPRNNDFYRTLILRERVICLKNNDLLYECVYLLLVYFWLINKNLLFKFDYNCEKSWVK